MDDDPRFADTLAMEFRDRDYEVVCIPGLDELSGVDVASFSFAIVDPALVNERVMSRLVSDIVYFDQQACSSPQQLYVRGAPGDTAVKEFVIRNSNYANHNELSRALKRYANYRNRYAKQKR